VNQHLAWTSKRDVFLKTTFGKGEIL